LSSTAFLQLCAASNISSIEQNSFNFIEFILITSYSV
jgi:hypothetical protein